MPIGRLLACRLCNKPLPPDVPSLLRQYVKLRTAAAAKEEIFLSLWVSLPVCVCV